MIFSSHNYKYKPVVEQVAIKQCAIYGLQNTFYDMSEDDVIEYIKKNRAEVYSILSLYEIEN